MWISSSVLPCNVTHTNLPIPSVVVILNPSAANKGNRHYKKQSISIVLLDQLEQKPRPDQTLQDQIRTDSTPLPQQKFASWAELTLLTAMVLSLLVTRSGFVKATTHEPQPPS